MFCYTYDIVKLIFEYLNNAILIGTCYNLTYNSDDHKAGAATLTVCAVSWL